MEKPTAPTTRKRIDSIDLFKGMAIVGIVWKHTFHPQWCDLVHISALFFILSGIFFKDGPFLPFLKKKVRTILVPFLFFYLLSFLARILFYAGHHRSLNEFDWSMLLQLFHIDNTPLYLSVNIPLWFLICLFVMQIIFWGLNRLIPHSHRTIGFLLAIGLLYVACPIIEEWRTPFMANIALECLPYFIVGNLFGLPIARYLARSRNRLLVAALGLALFIALQYLPVDFAVLSLIKSFSLFIALLALLTCIEGSQSAVARFVRTCGESSLHIMGLHVIILAPLQPIACTITGEPNLLAGAIALALTLLIIYLLIPIVNKYIPWTVGKKRTQTIHTI